MHAPNPLGGYPLSMRSVNVADPRKGELLFDYDTDDLYYVNKQNGQIKSVAKDIYDKLISIKLENSSISIHKDTAETVGEETILPAVENRKMNTWYIAIKDRKSALADEE